MLLILFNACSGLLVRTEKSNEYKKILEYYNTWQIEEGEKLLKAYTLSLEEEKELKKLFERRKRQKLHLDDLEKLARDAIYKGEVRRLSPYISSTIRTRTALRRMDKQDIKGSRVYFGKREFYLDELNMLMIINHFGENIYIDLQLQYRIDRWLIESFDERR